MENMSRAFNCLSSVVVGATLSFALGCSSAEPQRTVLPEPGSAGGSTIVQTQPVSAKEAAPVAKKEQSSSEAVDELEPEAHAHRAEAAERSLILRKQRPCRSQRASRGAS
jgi:hypothetical protein